MRTVAVDTIALAVGPSFRPRKVWSFASFRSLELGIHRFIQLFAYLTDVNVQASATCQTLGTEDVCPASWELITGVWVGAQTHKERGRDFIRWSWEWVRRSLDELWVRSAWGAGRRNEQSVETASTKVRGWREAAWCWGLNFGEVALKLRLVSCLVQKQKIPREKWFWRRALES